MATNITKREDGLKEVTVAINGAEWKDAQKKAFDNLAKNVQIKGFRKGKAPANLVKDRIGGADLFNEAIRVAYPTLVEKAIVDNKLLALQGFDPELGLNKCTETELEVRLAFVCQPDVTLGKYKGLGIKKTINKVTEKDVKEAIDRLLANNSELVLKEDGVAALGDTVVIDFNGYVDGKEFDGGSSKNYSLELGSNTFIPGFEEQLVGAKSESKVDVNVKFPENYVKELAGKDAKFVCMVHEIKTKKVPELNDDFVAGLNYKDVKTVEDLKKYEEGQIINSRANEATNTQLNEIIHKIVETSKFEIAKKLFDAWVESVKQDFANQITQQGFTYEQYKEITGVSEEQLHEQYVAEADHRIKEILVIDKICEAEKITVDRKEIDAFYENYAKAFNVSVEEFKKRYGAQERNFVENMRTEKVQKFLIDNNEKAVKEEAKKEAATKKEPAKKEPAKKETKKTTKK